ncbi:SKP1-like protein 14 [Macadamia integrifolia]|uniref:SKP1-like protein 14 n=1 Tax=Macadamia integrifolia TaxID=60698 RepID=UPI001C4F3F34|nr:SKP1-like protein 14 [Macadamia integrifolia]
MVGGSILLKSSNGYAYVASEGVSLFSETIREHMHKHNSMDIEITIPKVSREVVAEVIKFCEMHAFETSVFRDENEIKKWDSEFVNHFDEATLLGLGIAAEFLQIKRLQMLIATKIPRDGKTCTETSLPLKKRKWHHVKNTNGRSFRLKRKIEDGFDQI